MKLKDIAVASGIDKVYWVDDQFGEGGLQLAQKLLIKIKSLMGSEIKPSHVALSEFEFTGIQNDDIQAIQKVLTGKPGLGHELLQALDEQIKEASPGDEAIKDLTTAQVDFIAGCFNSVVKLSLAKWKEQQSSILEGDNSNSLFLIDHDFSLEDGGSAKSGEDVLQSILASSSKRALCILFTHGTARGKEHLRRREVCVAIGSPSQQHFAVVCKEHITLPAEGGEIPLAEAFQDAFMREWCDSLVDTVQTVFVDAFNATKSDIMDLAFEEISSSFFRRSVSDGVSEFDVLVRVMMLAGRVAVEDSRPHQAELWGRLAKIRKVMSVGGSKPPRPVRLEGNLTKLRQREIMDTSEVVNGVFAYPACGDVFEYISGKKKQQYVLIGQPCHLAIRSDGSRKNSEALFLSVSEKEGLPGRCYPFDFPVLGKRWISFDKVYPVNLYLIDLCSFNADGAFLLRKDSVPSDLFLPGVRKHFDKLKGFLLSHKKGNIFPFKFRRLTICSECYDKDAEAKDDGSLELPFKRIGRIRSPHAEAILGGFAVYHTRMAFDYDFSEEEDKQSQHGETETETK